MIKRLFYTIFVITSIAVVLLVAVTTLPRGSSGSNLAAQTNLDNSSKLGPSVFDKLKTEKSTNFRFEQKPINPCVGIGLKDQPIPTNRIWSSVPFGCNLQALITFPFYFKAEGTKFIVSLPRVVAKEDTIITDNSLERIEINLERPVDKVFVEDYSDLSVKISLRDSVGEVILMGTFVQGLPYFYLSNFANNNPIKLKSFGLEQVNNANLNFKSNTGGIAIFGTSNFNWLGTTEANIEVLDKNQTITFGYYNSPESLNQITQRAPNQITKINADYRVDESSAITTFNIQYDQAAPKKESWIGLLPHQYLSQKPNSPFQANTIRGQQVFVETGESFETSAPRQPMLENLLLDNLSPTDSQLLTTNLAKDVDSIRLDTNTSYFGGKNIAKIARLLQIADTLGQSEQKDRITNILTGEMENWLNYTPGENGKYFSYDTTIGGLIASKPEFDSGNYNDHHFHYGYFIYAAAMLAKYNPEFAQTYNSVIESIIKNIANPKKTTTEESFPHLRNYDYWEGHSWASGYAPFGDGNNQESTSEAINAWYSIWLWGRYTGNIEWENLGTFLYSNEVNTAKEYWLMRQSSSEPIYASEYKNKIVSIVWGGKVDYGTFFSRLPLDIYGIQYLPITPGSIYLYDTKKIESDEVFLSTSLERKEGKLGDYVVAYLGLLRGRKVLSDEKLNSLTIDDGNTRTNLIYWLIFWENISNIQSQKNTDNSSIVVYERKDKSFKVLVSCRQQQDVVIKVNSKDIAKTCEPGTNLLN